KTEVINDIVFQTKVLSFNASVEAAKAPHESGKGFSEVATQIGDLSTLSANASLEISHILEQSVSQVDTIIRKNHEASLKLFEVNKIQVQETLAHNENC